MASTSGHMLAPLSRSPSASSLISEESFDYKTGTSKAKHATDDVQSEKKPVLGVRDLIHMARDEKDKKALLKGGPESPVAVAPLEIQLFGGTTASDNSSQEGVEGAAISAAAGSGSGLIESLRASEGPFARNIEIRGWKIVGGRTWTGAARVGAYVGRSSVISDFSLARLSRVV